MKKLFSALVLMGVAFALNAQTPPILRNPYTTNTVTAADARVASIAATAATNKISMTNGTGSSNALSRAILTMPKIVDLSSGVYMSFTNAPAANANTIFIQDIVLTTNQGGVILQFSQNAGDGAYGGLFLNPQHDPGGPGPAYSEFQWPMAHHMALGPGYSAAGGHLQFGINLGLTSYADTYMYFQRGGPYQGPSTYAQSLTNGLAFSNPLLFKSQGWVGGSGGGNTDRLPGIVGRYLLNSGTLGVWALDIFSEAGLTGADKFHPDLASQHTRFFSGDHKATKLGGGTFYAQTNATISGSTYMLDFADAQTWNFTASATTITLSSTNTLSQVMSNNTSAEATFLFRSRGNSISMVYPSGWNTNGNGLPTTIPAGTMLKVNATWLSPGGETNVLASGTIYKDQTFAWDSDAVAYLARLGGVTLAQSNYINDFYTTLKASGAYTNIEAMYPFCWANAASNGQNMVSTSYTIGWAGTINTNNATGVHFDGSSGYGDTGWKTTTSNFFCFAWVKVDATPANAWPFGTGGGSGANNTGIRHNGSLSFMDGFLPQTSVAVFATVPATTPSGYMINWVNNANYQMYYGTTPSVSTNTGVSGAISPYNVYVGGKDYENGAGNFWGGKLQCFAAGNKSMTAAQAASVFSAVQALNTAFAR